jgi:hypothetical protein
MPVLIKDRNGASTVADVDVTRLTEYTNTPNLSLVDKHTHALGGGNVDPVEGLRFIPGLAHPKKVSGAFGLEVGIEEFFYSNSGALVHSPQQLFDLTSYVPSTAGKQAWVVIGIELSTNTPTASAGDEVDITDNMTTDMLDGFDLSGLFPLGAVVLANGQTSIDDITDFADLRSYVDTAGDGIADVQWWNIQTMAGRWWGGEITDNGDGTVAVATGGGQIKADEAGLEDLPTAFQDGQGSKVSEVSWSAVASLAITDDAYNFIYYDGSAGVIAATTDFSVISATRDFTLGRVYKIGSNEIIVRLCGTNLWNYDRRNQVSGDEVFGVVLASGGVVSETGNRYLQVTAGVLWAEIVNRFSTDALDTSVADTFRTWWRDGVGGWNDSTGNTQVNNTQYDDGSGSLATLTANRYGVHWVYLVHDSSLHLVFGQDDYTLGNAELSSPPSSLPGVLAAYATIIARIIVQKNATNLYSVEAPDPTRFSSSGAADHGGLSGLGDDDHTQYYNQTRGDARYAQVGESFVVMSLSGNLTAERRLQAQNGVALTDGGAGGDATLDLDINGLSALTDPDSDADYFVMYDASATTHKKVLPTDLRKEDEYTLNEASDYTYTVNSWADIDATNLSLSVTTSGGTVFVHAHLAIRLNANVSSANRVWVDFTVDGTRHGGDDGVAFLGSNVNANEVVTVTFTRKITGLSDASHTFKLQWKVRQTDGVVLYAGAGTSLSDMHPQFWIMELR